MQEKVIHHNQHYFWTQNFGDPNNPPLLLIMGGGCQGIFWPEAFCQQLADSGYFVIRYDNRDTGLSVICDYEHTPYSLLDMADDATKILAAYGNESAHIVGTSMGSAIGQLLAIYYPERVSHLTLIASTSDLGVLMRALSGKKELSDLPAPRQDYLNWIKLLSECSRENLAEQCEIHLKGWRLLNGSHFPFDEALYRDLITKSLERMKNSKVLANHIAAINKSLDEHLFQFEKIRCPVNIIHGTEDPIFTTAHAETLAKRIPQAHLNFIQGMGHNINSNIYTNIVLEIINFE